MTWTLQAILLLGEIRGIVRGPAVVLPPVVQPSPQTEAVVH